MILTWSFQNILRNGSDSKTWMCMGITWRSLKGGFNSVGLAVAWGFAPTRCWCSWSMDHTWVSNFQSTNPRRFQSQDTLSYLNTVHLIPSHLLPNLLCDPTRFKRFPVSLSKWDRNLTLHNCWHMWKESFNRCRCIKDLIFITFSINVTFLKIFTKVR